MAHEDKTCKNPACKKIFTPTRGWQEFCESSCQQRYWREVYNKKADVDKRLTKIEEELGIKFVDNDIK
jgi:hypothetical protein